tara:strand:- start:2096 stop:2425 length:330 start_codon:yes stop_codon:yes gene_type:complete
MPTEIIQFNEAINSNIEKNDKVYFAVSNQGVLGQPQYAGEVNTFSDSKIVVNVDNSVTIPNDAFIFFSKNTVINESSLKGYYADLTLENSSNKKAELFAVTSNVTTSSK